jgi:hypothetical protein
MWGPFVFVSEKGLLQNHPTGDGFLDSKLMPVGRGDRIPQSFNSQRRNHGLGAGSTAFESTTSSGGKRPVERLGLGKGSSAETEERLG